MSQPSPADSLDQRRASTVDEFCERHGLTRRRAFSVEEVASMFALAPSDVKAAISDGELRAVKISPKITRICREDIEAWQSPAPTPEIMDGEIYFIDDGFFIKIGFSKDPKDRMIKLQTASPFKLKLMHSIKGNRRLERELHEKFRLLKSHGEWFRGERELRQYIREITT